MSASAAGQRAANRGEIGPQTDLMSRKPAPAEIECINSRCCGCCADLPKTAFNQEAEFGPINQTIQSTH